MIPAYMVFVNRKGILLKGTAPLVLLGFVCKGVINLPNKGSKRLTSLEAATI
jgi:hypothetical protein